MKNVKSMNTLSSFSNFAMQNAEMKQVNGGIQWCPPTESHLEDPDRGCTGSNGPTAPFGPRKRLPGLSEKK